MNPFALVAIGLAAAQDTPRLVAPSEFEVELVDQAPALRWPSAVLCLDDGSLLVAEDPMDMPGPTDQPIDRIWLYRWREDGGFTRTLFAQDLYAVFGLEQIDGVVYVMNMPCLTVLRDLDGDGVAELREELLTDLGPPAPGHPGGFNDHIVSGLRLGIDGWLYVAVGDKGVPLANGRDGSRISLRGGGVVRLRPDGTQLQVVASGLRNILDVAMDADGEMFTYDNTDDGLGWWTRLTHVVPGGYYGYPWDYHDEPRRFLPPMADYGPGSPTGGLVKREGGWPKPYEGSLFFCEWGDGTLRRFDVERDGETFRVAAMEEFLKPGDVENFRPTDVCESPDGRFLYVSDWGHGGWVSKQETGRLWRVRLDGDRGGPSLKPDPAVRQGIAARLDSPRWSTRMAAQRELVRGGDAAAAREAMAVGGRAALHARHALAQLDVRPNDAKACLSELDVAERSGDAVARRRALAELVFGADGSWTADPAARASAWRAAQSGGIARHLWRRLAAGSLTPVQFAKLFEDGPEPSLELLDAVQDFAVRLAEARRGDLAEAWRTPFADLQASGLVPLARGDGGGRELAVRAAALRTLAVLARVPPPWEGTWWSIAPARQTHSTRTEDWSGTGTALAAIEQALAATDSAVRAAAIEAAALASDPRLAPALRALTATESDSRARRALLAALAPIGQARDAVWFADCARSGSQLEERLDALRLGASFAPEALCEAAIEIALDDSTPEVLLVAALELCSTSATDATALRAALFEVADRRISHAADEVRRAACTLAAVSDGERAVDWLTRRLDDAPVRATAFLALCDLADPRSADVFAQGLIDQDPALRSAARRAILRVKDDVLARYEARVAAGDMDGRVVAELQRIYSGQQPLLEWDVIGPIAASAPEAKSEQPPDRAALEALPGVRVLRVVSARDDGFIDLRGTLGDKSDQVAYAFARVSAARDRDVEFFAGSDDQLRVWLDGRRIHDYDGARAFTARSDRFDGRLRAGENAFVLRIGQIGGDWGFALTVPIEGQGPLFQAAVASEFNDAEYASFAAANPGDAKRGSLVARDSNRTLCLRCHVVDGQGQQVGPELTGLGARYTRDEIVQSILQPSARLAEGYAAVLLLTTDDRLHVGQLRSDTPTGVTLVDSSGTAFDVPREEIAEVRPSTQSIMPEGLCRTMSREEFADLIAWLCSLR